MYIIPHFFHLSRPSFWLYSENLSWSMIPRATIKKKITRRIATWWRSWYRIQYRLVNWKTRYGRYALVTIFFFLLLVVLYLLPIFQDVLGDHYSSQQRIEELRALMLNIGSALIGATAIVASLVLFATQVNVERLPHGLFHRLSKDRKLLGAFGSAFILAIVVTTLSTFIDHEKLAIVVIIALLSIVLILYLFLYAYGRALNLINPLQQLRRLRQTTRKELQGWARRAQRTAPLREWKEESEGIASPYVDSTHDLARMAFFSLATYWTDGTKRAIGHAMSFARHYAEQGDYEVSEAALKTIVIINAEYIKSKGKTFDISTTESLISDTLEHLRKNVQAANARRDEQQIEQTLQAMATLLEVYLDIDYSSTDATKSHANLAAQYLADAVQTVAPHNMADVLMEGQRLMGRCAGEILTRGNPANIATLSEKIALIACAGCVKEDYRPVTMEGMTQFSDLTFYLLVWAKGNNIHFAGCEIRRNVAMVVKSFLNVTDTNIHSTFLGPYYSSTSIDCLQVKLMNWVNIHALEYDNEETQAFIHNLEKWADGLYETEKELLLAAIEAKSQFTFDMIHWISGITEILLAASNAPACDNSTQQKIRRHALWLISTLDWIPDDQEIVRFVENFQMTETLFKAAMDARDRGCDEIANEIGRVLLSWTFKGGKFQTGWNVLERGLCACAVFALMGGKEQIVSFKAAISRLLSDVALTQEMRDRAAVGIREKIEKLQTQEPLPWSQIDVELSKADYESLRPLLQDVANILSSPNAAL